LVGTLLVRAVCLLELGLFFCRLLRRLLDLLLLHLLQLLNFGFELRTGLAILFLFSLIELALHLGCTLRTSRGDRCGHGARGS